MNKLLTIFWTVAFAVAVSGISAQDLAPSQQAQGYLDAQNTTVDHATGLFHYRVPIYTLRSGDFELPISLNYVSKWVKVDDLPGLVGHNWNLNVGGVVTRTIRGGIADETPKTGYIHQNFSTPPTIEQKNNVHKREADGESDIFTAVFNGQSVSFIIKKVGENAIIAEPLERTNVRIWCDRTVLKKMNEQNVLVDSILINGWTITDENGNEFYFGEKEWSADIIKDEGTSINGIMGKTYISSWYLSRIEPRNSPAIIYSYKEDVDPLSTQENINEVEYSFIYDSKYVYGRYMIHKPFVFSNYQRDFNNYMDQALNFLYGLEDALYDRNRINVAREGAISNLTSQGAVAYYGPLYHREAINIKTQVENNQRVMGQLTGFRDLIAPSAGVVDYLDDLYEYYTDPRRWGSSYDQAYNAARNFRLAAGEMKKCLEDTVHVWERTVTTGTQMKIKSPILTSVDCGNTSVKFNYRDLHLSPGDGSLSYQSKKLASARVDNIMEGRVLDVNLTGDWNLEQLSFIDKYYREFNRVEFDYNVNLLSKITTMDKGEIEITYGSNTSDDRRISSLTFRDPVSNTEDIIRYHYPYLGEMVYNEYFYMETIDYSYREYDYVYTFSDQITHSKPKSRGLAFLNLGNNGVYYDYVEEEFVGKGKKTYLFFNPKRLSNYNSVYKFWLNGLPLGVATYDNDGNLKSIIKNSYYADFDSSDYSKSDQGIENIYRSGSWLHEGNNHMKYLNTETQIPLHEHNLDYEAIYKHYLDQRGGNPYGIKLYRNVYFDPVDLFYHNVEPRMYPISDPARPRLSNWGLKYGGKVLLKSQEEYRIEGNYSSGSSIDHFIATDLGAPFNKVEYHYDNIANSTAPTRISTTDSQGDILTTVMRRVGDMNVQGNTVLTGMKAQNVLSPVVKVQNLRGNMLLSEVVNVYGASQHGSKTYFGLAQERSYFPANSVTISSFPATDNALFTYGEINYTTEKEMNYVFGNGWYTPAGIAEKGETMSLCYDFSLNAPIFKARGYSNNYVSAANSYYRELSGIHDDISSLHSFQCFYYDYIPHIEQWGPPYMTPGYFQSEAFRTVKMLAESVATKFEHTDYDIFVHNHKLFVDNYLSWKNDFISLWYKLPVIEFHYMNAVFDILYNSAILREWISYHYKKISNNMSLNIDQIAQQGAKLYLVSKDFGGSIPYTMMHSGGYITRNAQSVSKSHWNVQALNIDLSGFSGITSVEVDMAASQNIAYMALVPADCEFEAVAYNADGTVFCRFDQTGIMERYEYDGAGRVTKVFDGEGNLLKENRYNRPQQ